AKSPTGIPPTGAVELLRNDPLTQGPKLFARNCASCHRYDGHDGTGLAVKDPQSGSDLQGFASRNWLTGLLDPAKVDTTNYFGGTKFKDTKMVKFVKKDIAAHSAAEKEQLKKVIFALSAEAGLKSQREADRRDAAAIVEGRKLMESDAMRCTECHQFRTPTDDATAPDLTGYGSREWLVGIIANPKHERFYGQRNDRMPAFGADQVLDAKAIGLIADWLRGDWYEPEGVVSR
ncbi:MAG: menaquinol-cytochrome C reductase, partial [Opitutaceae bacterium]|nr:menaquinol-cytochrome C reductase [Verrucomicrobiales bacterium]